MSLEQGMFGNIGKMMKVAGELQRKLPELQAMLADSRYTAEAGDGAVTATVSGKLALVDLAIDGKALEDIGGDALAGMIKAAVGAAQEKASHASAEAVEQLTGGMKIPGLGGLLG